MKTHLNSTRCKVRFLAIGCLFVGGVLVSPWALADHQSAGGDAKVVKKDTASKKKSAQERLTKGRGMKVYYLEIVTKEVNAVCAAYAAANGAQFGKPDAGLGNARTAEMPDGGMVGVRAPMRADEEPIVRPYWLVDDIKAALDAAVKAGGEVAHPPLEIPGHGTFAIYIKGGINHGLWQR